MSGDLKAGMESSEGDIRVLVVINLVLSVGFAGMAIYAADLANVTTFTWSRVLGFAAIIFVLGFIVSMD